MYRGFLVQILPTYIKVYWSFTLYTELSASLHLYYVNSRSIFWGSHWKNYMIVSRVIVYTFAKKGRRKEEEKRILAAAVPTQFPKEHF